MKIADIKVEYINHCGDDLSVVNAARVSFDKESKWEEEWYRDDPDDDGLVKRRFLSQQDTKLINYLAKHKHKSPFNHAFISLRVKAPVFVARQLVKHKFLPWNEVSRRYVDSEPEFYVPENWRIKAENVKQGSSDEVADKQWLFQGDYTDNEEAYSTDDFTQLPLNLYNWLLMNKVCAEQARIVLPQNTMTEWIWSGTLGAFADMLILRLDSHTQAESRIVAQQAKNVIEPLFPVSLKALLDNA